MNMAIVNNNAKIALEELDKISGGYHPMIGNPFIDNPNPGSPINPPKKKDDGNEGGGVTGGW